MNLKIENVEVFGVEVPLVGEYKSACKSKSVQRSVVVGLGVILDDAKMARYRFVSVS